MSEQRSWDVNDALTLADLWQSRYSGIKQSREFFPQIHALAEYLHNSGQVSRAVELLQCEVSMGVERFLTHRLEHARLLVRAFLDNGQRKEALELVEYYCSRPYLFDDLSKLGFFLFCRSAYSLATCDAIKLAHCVTLLVETQAGMKDANLIRVIHMAGGARALFKAAGRLKLSTRVLIRIFDMAQRLTGKGVVAGVIGRGLHFALNIWRSIKRLKGDNVVELLPRRTTGDFKAPLKNTERPIVVTRAMGGIGDLLMITPGLKALHKKFPHREIYFAIPKSFHQLFANNKYFYLKDINKYKIYYDDISILFNLTDCPASRVESSTLPNVKQNRIDIFLSALSIKENEIIDKKPVYCVTNEEKNWACNFLNQHCITPEKFIAIQPYAADNYRNYPHIEKVIFRLSKIFPVLVFHNTPITSFCYPNVIKIDKYQIRQSIAIMSMCSLLIAIDSSFIHIAAAFDKKTISLFGPIDGTVRTSSYQNCISLNGYKNSFCSPCWRNQSTICAKSTATSSLCMESIDADKIIIAAIKMMNSYITNQ